jgi:hypothetical protein
MLKVNSNDFPNSVSCHKENEHDQKASTSTSYSKLYKNFLVLLEFGGRRGNTIYTTKHSQKTINNIWCSRYVIIYIQLKHIFVLIISFTQ